MIPSGLLLSIVRYGVTCCMWGLVDVWAMRRVCRAAHAHLKEYDESLEFPFIERIRAYLSLDEQRAWFLLCLSAKLAPPSPGEFVSVVEALRAHNGVLSGSLALAAVVYGRVWADDHDIDVFMPSLLRTEDNIARVRESLPAESEAHLEWLEDLVNDGDRFERARLMPPDFARFLTSHGLRQRTPRGGRIQYVEPTFTSRYFRLSRESTRVSFMNVITVSERQPLDVIASRFDLSVCKVALYYDAEQQRFRFWAASAHDLERRCMHVDARWSASADALARRIRKYEARGFTVAQ